jgi:hypothetical protein
LEEVLEAEDNFLQDQIADYEAWEDTKSHADASDDSVLCPLCQISYLMIVPDNDIICPEIACPLRIDAVLVERPLCILRDQLRTVHEEHACHCSNNLTFDIIANNQQHHLVAFCHLCGLVKSFE